ncbi:MAG: hypothetical protein AAB415_00810 [Patescibacteria group bacterium]
MNQPRKLRIGPKKLELREKEIEKKLNNISYPLGEFSLPTICRVTGRWSGDIYSFGDNRDGNGVEYEEEDYAHFLSKVQTLEDLRQGLKELSPFADDALAVAETMDDADFVEFKLTLAHEKRMLVDHVGESRLPRRYLSLVLPTCLLKAGPVAQEFNVSIGVAMLRLVQEGIDIFPRQCIC